MNVVSCRVCGNKFFEEPLLRYKNMPKAAQYLPDAESLESDKGVDLEFCRPHMSLRETVNAKTKSFEQIWKQKTPGMAAGLTDHVWTFRELLTVKFAHAP